MKEGGGRKWGSDGTYGRQLKEIVNTSDIQLRPQNQKRNLMVFVRRIPNVRR